MKTIRTISEDEMIAVFLKGELDSSRFRTRLDDVLTRLSLDHEPVARPDTSSEEDNEARRRILGEMHGYRQGRSLFRLFPTNVAWERVLLTRQELCQVLYINWDYWNELTEGSRRPVDSGNRSEVRD